MYSTNLRLAFINTLRFSSRSRLLYVSSMILGSVALLLLFISSSTHSSSVKLLSSSALKSIDVLPSQSSHLVLNKSLIRKLSHSQMVEHIYPIANGGAGIKIPHPAIEEAFLISTDLPIQEPPLIDSIKKHIFPLQEGEIVLPNNIAGEKMRPLLGMTVPFTLDGNGSASGAPTDNLKVVGIYDSTWQLDGHDAAIVDLATALRFASTNDPSATSVSNYLNTNGYSSLVVVANKADEVPKLVSRFSALGLYVTSYQEEVTGTTGLANTADVLTKFVFGGMVLILFGSSLSNSGTQIRQRRREVATMRALGFSRRSIGGQLVLELLIRGMEGAFGALVAGTLLVFGLMHLFSNFAKFIGASTDIPSFSSMAIVLTIEVLAISAGGAISLIRPLRVPPSQGLRDW